MTNMIAACMGRVFGWLEQVTGVAEDELIIAMLLAMSALFPALTVRPEPATMDTYQQVEIERVTQR